YFDGKDRSRSGGIDLRCGFARSVHLAKTRRVPKFGREIAALYDLFFIEANVLAARRNAHQAESQTVRAVFVDQLERIRRVAQRFRHLPTLLIPNQSREKNVAEWNVVFDAIGFSRFEFQPGNDHARNPKENNVRRSHENAGRIEFLWR